MDNIRMWYDTFDSDKSDEIEIKEFLAMLTQLKIIVEARLVVMIFKLFDRGNVNFFRYCDFEDIILERIKPNYRKIVELER
jgi:Ca2+-binding EF-hand superfamily protein